MPPRKLVLYPFERCETSVLPVFGLPRGSAAAEGIRATREGLSGDLRVDQHRTAFLGLLNRRNFQGFQMRQP
jgi:hypothetical protein